MPWQRPRHGAFAPSDGLAEKPNGPHSCAICCCVFSLIGVIFLSLLSAHFSSDSLFVEYEGDRAEAASNLSTAAVLYAVTMVISAFFWVRGVLRARAGSRAGAGGFANRRHA
mmetsp:Transcript_25098/g.87552  ORF Transcript_25098/g.87552 Transcript_25098/m.87552 type:complete len:112 (-) Transcript_25098:35-370(-)